MVTSKISPWPQGKFLTPFHDILEEVSCSARVGLNYSSQFCYKSINYCVSAKKQHFLKNTIDIAFEQDSTLKVCCLQPGCTHNTNPHRDTTFLHGTFLCKIQQCHKINILRFCTDTTKYTFFLAKSDWKALQNMGSVKLYIKPHPRNLRAKIHLIESSSYLFN